MVSPGHPICSPLDGPTADAVLDRMADPSPDVSGVQRFTTGGTLATAGT
jgi:hypothetical protein